MAAVYARGAVSLVGEFNEKGKLAHVVKILYGGWLDRHAIDLTAEAWLEFGIPARSFPFPHHPYG